MMFFAALAWIGIVFTATGVISDFVLPHCKRIEKFIDELCDGVEE